jgi:hypothetical protein
MKSWSTILVPFATLACAGPLQGATTFQLAYYPQDLTVPPPVPTCSGPIAVAVSDVRRNPAEAGQRFAQDQPTVVYPILMTGDAAAYVGAALEMGFKRAGSPGLGQTASTLSVWLIQLRLEEKTFFNAEFSGAVGLEVADYVANSQTPCWRGQVTGAGTNYGRAANPENYQETLNRALEKAVSNLLAEKAFLDALCGKCASP